jgi:alkylated DNA repair dioxygenase AlkB
MQLPTGPGREADSRRSRAPATPEWRYEPGFLAPGDADLLLEGLLRLTDWERLRLRIFGREVEAPRLTAWYGDPGASYAYSGVVHEPRPWPECLVALRDRLRAELGAPFNSVLANLYRDGRDSMGWHSDDERELGEQPLIASVSLGARRRFLLRQRGAGTENVELELEHGSLFAMWGSTQRRWKHRVPRSARCHEPRVNLTFRYIRTADRRLRSRGASRAAQS